MAALDWLQRQEASSTESGAADESARARVVAAAAQRRALLEAALEGGRNLLQTSKPSGTSAMTSAPLARQVAQILDALARAELALGAGASEAAEESGGRLEIPLVEGRNAGPVRRWVNEAEELGPAAVQRRREANREQAHEERAVVSEWSPRSTAKAIKSNFQSQNRIFRRLLVDSCRDRDYYRSVVAKDTARYKFLDHSHLRLLVHWAPGYREDHEDFSSNRSYTRAIVRFLQSSGPKRDRTSNSVTLLQDYLFSVAF